MRLSQPLRSLFGADDSASSPSTRTVAFSGSNGDANGPVDGAAVPGRLGGERILAPLLDPEVPAITDQINLAATIARATGASLHVMNPVSVPDQVPMEFREDVTTDDDRALLDWAVDQVADASPAVDGGLLHNRRLVNGVLRAVSNRGIDTLVLPGDSPSGLLGRESERRIAARAECDVVTVNGQSGYDDVASILLPVSGGPHSGLAADVARCVAADCDAWIDVLHVINEDATDRERDDAEAYVEAASRRVARPETTSTWVLAAESPVEAIVEQSTYYGLTVLGAPTKSRLSRFVRGSANRSVRSRARSVVLSARNNTDCAPLNPDGAQSRP